ncbi:MAG: large-conductance mechanosensitive channel protein MscL [Bacteroidales bacterium]
MKTKGLIQEFKQFAMRGNVSDMAIGIIIGAAFGKIVSSLVADIIMPPIGLLVGGVNFTNLKIVMQQANELEGLKEVSLNYGNFLQVIFDFIIVAFCIFMLIKFMNRLSDKKDAETPPPPAEPSKEEKLLTEIRDLLKGKK